jgi:hypothetical protein
MIGDGDHALRLPYNRSYYANNNYGFQCSPYPRCHAGMVFDALTTLGTVLKGNFSIYADPLTKKIHNLIGALFFHPTPNICLLDRHMIPRCFWCLLVLV